jgi:homogentisate 1,2-dioxygenase
MDHLEKTGGSRSLGKIIGALKRELDERGAKKILLLVSPTRRHVDALRFGLREYTVDVFDDAMVHVPKKVVEKALKKVDTFSPDVLLSVGGGATVGLGKAIKLEHPLPLFCIPTTYSGSERTRIWGITENGEKKTGRDDNARVDVVFYAPALTTALPISISIQSLLNALAHPISALAHPDTPDALVPGAQSVIYEVEKACRYLLVDPGDPNSRRWAATAAGNAAAILEDGRMGLHHQIAHTLGGQFNLPHAALHSVVLPHFVEYLAQSEKEVHEKIRAGLQIADPARQIFDLLKRSGAPTSLADLGLELDSLEASEFFKVQPASVQSLLKNAFFGVIPSSRIKGMVPEKEGALPGVHFGARLDQAKKVVIALHGRGGSAHTTLELAREALADNPEIAIVAPQAPERRWYARSFRSDFKDLNPQMEKSAARVSDFVERIKRASPRAEHFVFGFSQGACLCLQLLSEGRLEVHGVAAFCGGRPGPRDAQKEPVPLPGTPILLGAASQDPWITPDEIVWATETFSRAGAAVQPINSRGSVHGLTALQRRAFRELVLGKDAPKADWGFGNHASGEVLPGANPKIQNTPRKAPWGLVPEKINGTAFTARREENKSVWLHRVRPSAQNRDYEKSKRPSIAEELQGVGPLPHLSGHPPLALPEIDTDFFDGLKSLGASGDPANRRGYWLGRYACNTNMENESVVFTDGELLLLPEKGRISLQTELGFLDLSPGEVGLIPRGHRFSVHLKDSVARGYVAEVYGRHFRLPDRGLIGSNGLAEERHFRGPLPHGENRLAENTLIHTKSLGAWYQTAQDYSPYDVMGWHGNDVPRAYDLRSFSPVSNVRFDHVDPSAYSVLTAPLDERGAHTLDLVVFPARIDATTGTFRPPFAHKNAVWEINGIIQQVGAKKPFEPGCVFITPSMTPHMTAAHRYEAELDKSDAEADRPQRFGEHAMWFQFEATLPLTLTPETWRSRIRHWRALWGDVRTAFGPV